MAEIAYLECSKCGIHISPAKPQTICPNDHGSLYVRYDLDKIKSSFTRESLRGRCTSIWRYKDVLPGTYPITLGEGFTPLLRITSVPNLFIKDESLNPTGSFKARGLSVGVTMARHYGLRKLVVPSAGNAASALAAYCAVSGLEAYLFMPRDVPMANRVEGLIYGAKVTLVDGVVSDCMDIVERRKENEGWFDITSLKEPFRLEGKKTMGYEVAEQLGWELPDAILFPTGGGVGLIGMWKAFEEMEQLKWIGQKRPRMICVQASGCAPIVKAWNERKSVSEVWQNAQTLASGIRVPRPYGDYLVLDILKKSGGTAICIRDEQILSAMQELAAISGVFVSPEGAASFAAYKTLREENFLKMDDKVVLFNTASGLKYVDVISSRLPAMS